MRLDEYRAVLKEVAQSISGASYPRDVITICRALGVEIRRKAIAQGKALLLATPGATQIALPERESPDKYTALERFQVAHELGHLVLARRCNASPLGKKEYWVHEGLCDEFALDLLLPRPQVATWLNLSMTSPTQLLGFSVFLSRRAQIPWFVACTRLSEIVPAAGILELAGERSQGLRVVNSSLPRRKERGRVVKPETRLWRELQSLQPHEAAILDADCVSTFPSFADAVEVAAVRTNESRIRLAVKCRAAVGRS